MKKLQHLVAAAVILIGLPACQRDVAPATASSPVAQMEMKTHTTIVPGATVTVVHFGAPY